VGGLHQTALRKTANCTLVDYRTEIILGGAISVMVLLTFLWRFLLNTKQRKQSCCCKACCHNRCGRSRKNISVQTEYHALQPVSEYQSYPLGNKVEPEDEYISVEFVCEQKRAVTPEENGVVMSEDERGRVFCTDQRRKMYPNITCSSVHSLTKNQETCY